MADRVVPLWGEAVPSTREPRETVIAELEKVLEMARSGEVQGITLVRFHADACATWSIAGIVNSYSMLGAVDVAKAALLMEQDIG